MWAVKLKFLLYYIDGHVEYHSVEQADGGSIMLLVISLGHPFPWAVSCYIAYHENLGLH